MGMPLQLQPGKGANHHFALGFGAGYCVGRYVGRVEAAETIKALLAETQSFELDPKGREPKWAGEMYHSIAPLDTLLR